MQKKLCAEYEFDLAVRMICFLQPAYGGRPNGVAGDVFMAGSRAFAENRIAAADSRLGAALDYSWSLDFAAKDNASGGKKQEHDKLY